MNPLAIFAGPMGMLYKWGIIAALAAVVWGHGWVKGNGHGTQKLTDYVGAQAVATLKLIKQRAEVVTKIQVKYEKVIEQIFTKGETIEKEVPIYVTKADDAGCVIPVGWVREYNAAWSGTPAGSPLETDRGPSGVPLSEAAAADAHNATSCLTLKAQRDGLIELYQGLQKLDPKQ